MRSGSFSIGGTELLPAPREGASHWAWDMFMGEKSELNLGLG